MTEHRSEFLNQVEGGTANFMNEEFTRLERFMERKGRATVSTTAAPIEDAPARSTSMGMSMPSTTPELRDRENLGIFLKIF